MDLPLISFKRDIWDWVKDRTWLEILVRHKSPVMKVGALYHLIEEGRPTLYPRGLTTLMGDVLYNKREPDTMSPVEKRVVALQKRTASRVRGKPPPLRGRHGRLKGWARGLYIHGQIEDYVRLTGAQFLEKYPERMHPWAALIIRAMYERNWRPVFGEFLVHDREMLTAHAVDVVGVDEEGVILWIEVKTGDSGGLFDHDESCYWRPGTPFAGLGWPATPRHRALTQIMLGATMGVSNLSLPLGSFRVLVAHVDNTRVNFIEAEHSFLLAQAPRMFAFLRKVRAKELREKEAAKQAKIRARKAKSVHSAGNKGRHVDCPQQDRI
jgi:hypothetical protein